MKYNFIESPPEKMTQLFPCTAWLHWPGYDTKIIETVIDGRNVLIQLWKGYFGIPNTLIGVGFGAEIGIYWKSVIPGYWWPDHKHKKMISFTLVNPITNEEFFSAEPKNCWWLHKWMTKQSYKEYKKNHKVPNSPTEYVLKFAIGSSEYLW